MNIVFSPEEWRDYTLSKQFYDKHEDGIPPETTPITSFKLQQRNLIDYIYYMQEELIDFMGGETRWVQ